MARVSYGPLITDFTGSIGGVTFQRNASGAIARMRPTLYTGSSALQLWRQQILRETVVFWSGLTCEQRVAWQAFANAHPRVNDWNETHQLNALQWFMSVNINLYNGLNCVNVDPPIWAVENIPTTFTLNAASDHFWIYFDSDYTPTGKKVEVFVSLPLRSSNLKFRKNQFSLGFLEIVENRVIYLMELYEQRFNIVWSELMSSTAFQIIVRVKTIDEISGLSSPFQSKIICF